MSVKKRIETGIGCLMIATSMYAGDIRGVVIDKELNEPLMGAAIRILNTTKGVTSDMNGEFTIKNLKKGTYTIEISYISFYPQRFTVEVPSKGEVNINAEMLPDNKQLSEVTIVAQKKLELEKALLSERQHATLAIENLGASEMSIKGISNVQDGVKKISGISIAEAGQVVVRGLGDRYSTTTLNGMPIASPNPDNKLIPLNLFPSSIVQNITVSKVYDATYFADYSGAHIDISTKEGGSDFFNLSVNTGSTVGTIGNDFYSMDREKTLFRNPGINPLALDLPYKEFKEYALNNSLFKTSFQTSKKTALPDLGGNIGAGHTFNLGGNKLNLLGSLGIKSDFHTIENAYTSIYDATGNEDKYFEYNSYSQGLNITGLFNVGYSFRTSDHINFTGFYARNAEDKYMLRDGHDAERHQLVGSNQNTRIYELQNYQIQGDHYFGKKWQLSWNGSYSKTQSDEPDRRQVMFEKKDDGTLTLFSLNQQETMRYFGMLDENEWVGDIQASYSFNENNKIFAGIAYKDKSRDYKATRFYYDVRGLDVNIENPYETDGYLNDGNIHNGSISLIRAQYDNDKYSAGNQISAAFLRAEYHPLDDLLIDLGVRVEDSKQWVKYFNDDGTQNKRNLNKIDLFPALNMKYGITSQQSVRFAASRTITRPSFIEMAPFAYQESYGSAQIRGNEKLNNAYNYNVDLRYEFFRENSSDMFAITAYYKYLESPIERIQRYAGGSLQHSFQNATDGLATGVELEIRKDIVKDLRFTFNGSYMYTNVKLPEGGAYTHHERALQGASPYLFNADLSYSPTLKNKDRMFITAVYNFQGERIHSVGVSGMGDVVQVPLHTLDFIYSYQFNDKLSAKLQIKNILNSDIVFEQDLPITKRTQEVERYNEGIGFDLGITYKF